VFPTFRSALRPRDTKAHTYDDVPIWCLINHWLTKYTRRPVTTVGHGFQVIVTAPDSETPTFRRCIRFWWSMPNLQTAGCSWCTPRTFTSLSSPRDVTETNARHTACDRRIWIAQPFKPDAWVDPFGRTGYSGVLDFPFADQANLTSASYPLSIPPLSRDPWPEPKTCFSKDLNHTQSSMRVEIA
jgi:hypothetical protein